LKTDKQKEGKIYIYIQFVGFIIIGLASIFYGFSNLKKTLKMKFDHSSYIYFTDDIFFIAAGIFLMNMGILTLKKYRKRIKKLESEKNKTN
jgi:uncharacterized membrane protein